MNSSLPVRRDDLGGAPADNLLDALEQARHRCGPQTCVAVLRIATPAGMADAAELRTALAERLRETDQLHALGAGDFGLVIEVARSDEAVGVAQRLAGHEENQPPIAVGIAVLTDEEPDGRLLARAERAVRLARAGGVQLAPPPDTTQERVARTYWL